MGLPFGQARREKRPCKSSQVIKYQRDTVSTEGLRPDLADLERPALESALDARGHERFRARQIFRWIYRHGVTDIDAMTDLSRDLRAALAEAFTLATPQLVERERSIDGTEKFLLRLGRRPADRVGLHPRHAGR